MAKVEAKWIKRRKYRLTFTEGENKEEDIIKIPIFSKDDFYIWLASEAVLLDIIGYKITEEQIYDALKKEASRCGKKIPIFKSV